MLALSDAGPGMGRNVVIDLLVVLLVAGLVALGLSRLKLASIPGYLLAGAIIGPTALGLVSDSGNIGQISQLAVILLLFTVGLHLDVNALGRGVISILLAGLVSTFGVVLLLWPLILVFGIPAPMALVVAMAFSMSSTAIVVRMLQSRREMFRLHGRLCVGISITQDLLSLAMMASMPLLSLWAGKPASTPAGSAAKVDAGQGTGAITGWIREQTALGAGQTLGQIAAGFTAVAGIAILLLAGRFLLPLILKEAARERSGESTLVISSGLALAAAVFTAALGFSPELGAFIAGFMLASTPFRSQLAGQLAPMRDLFMAVFFTVVGLKLSIPTMFELWWVVLVGLVAVVTLKALVIGGSVWAMGATGVVAGRTGLALAQAGEFSMVIIGVASLQGLTTARVDAVAIAICVLSLIVSPWLFTLSDRLQPRLHVLGSPPWLKRSALHEASTEEERAQAEADLHAEQGHAAPAKHSAIIAGYGVIGRAIADHLEIHSVPFTIVELNAETVATQVRLGRRAVYGDIGNPEVLEAAGVRHADALFLTVPDDDASMRACVTTRTLAPDLFIAARTGYLSMAFRILAAGADEVVIGEVAIAEAMARKVLGRLESRKPRAPEATPPAASDAAATPAGF